MNKRKEFNYISPKLSLFSFLLLCALFFLCFFFFHTLYYNFGALIDLYHHGWQNTISWIKRPIPTPSTTIWGTSFSNLARQWLLHLFFHYWNNFSKSIFSSNPAHDNILRPLHLCSYLHMGIEVAMDHAGSVKLTGPMDRIEPKTCTMMSLTG